MKQNFLGIDWGGTYIKAGVVDTTGKVIRKTVLNTKEMQTEELFFAGVSDLLKRYKSLNIRAIGIGAPGVIFTKTGVIHHLGNVPGWENYPMKSMAEKRLNLPVFINNDANVFGLAESRLGAGKGADCAIFLTIGTGLGGAIIYHGQLLESETSACELGHVPVSLEGRKCGCGGTGCIETFVGNRHLLRRYRELASHAEDISSVEELYYRARHGNKVAMKVWEEFSRALGMFIAGMLNIFDPDVVVIGGGIAGAFSLFKPMVMDAIYKQGMQPFLRKFKLVRAKLRNPGIVGAALLAMENLNISLKK
jgi:glucokinase